MQLALVLQVFVITNTTVVDPSRGEKLAGQTVVVEGSRITAVGARVRVPRGGRVIDGRGTFVVPGFYDMHVHADVLGGRALRRRVTSRRLTR
jgi:imidazolonepropionase-like amidohydrolase